jgi:hypothetical protein
MLDTTIVKHTFYSLCFVLCLYANCIGTASAQTPVMLHAKVYDSLNYLPLPPVMVVNKRTGRGMYVSTDSFNIAVLPTDSIMISVLGYRLKTICLKDSLTQSSYTLRIALVRLYITLKEVEISPTRDLSEIQKDIDQLGMNIEPYSVTGINAAFSPITYLYERFSKFSNSKRKVEEWESEDLKRAILKDLFQLYVQYDIIQLDDKEFEAFVRYLNFSNEFIRTSTQLELVLAIKGKYESFKTRWK